MAYYDSYMSNYGAYVSETGGNGETMSLVGDENLESTEAWKYYGLSYLTVDPVWPYLRAKKGLNGIQPINGLPDARADHHRRSRKSGLVVGEDPEIIQQTVGIRQQGKS